MKTIEVEATDTSIEVMPSGGFALARVETDTQVATAKQWPRDEDKSFAMAMVAVRRVSEQSDAGLYYKLPRRSKDGPVIIEGPSVRLAEIIAKAYGNCRYGGAVVGEEGDFVIAHGYFWDLQSNSRLDLKVSRRIRNKEGVRYSDDMVEKTSNAARSIAYRTAILNATTKGFWKPLFDEARRAAGGRTKKETNEKAVDLTEMLKGSGITPRMICDKFGVKTVKELTSGQVADLQGLVTAIRDGVSTVAAAFGLPEKEKPTKSEVKSQAVNANDFIDTHQQQTVMTLLQDRGYSLSEIAKPLKTIGHKGSIMELKQAKYKELLLAIEKMPTKTKGSNTLFE